MPRLSRRSFLKAGGLTTVAVALGWKPSLAVTPPEAAQIAPLIAASRGLGVRRVMTLQAMNYSQWASEFTLRIRDGATLARMVVAPNEILSMSGIWAATEEVVVEGRPGGYVPAVTLLWQEADGSVGIEKRSGLWMSGPKTGG